MVSNNKNPRMYQYKTCNVGERTCDESTIILFCSWQSW